MDTSARTSLITSTSPTKSTSIIKGPPPEYYSQPAKKVFWYFPNTNPTANRYIDVSLWRSKANTIPVDRVPTREDEICANFSPAYELLVAINNLVHIIKTTGLKDQKFKLELYFDEEDEHYVPSVNV